MLLMEPTGDALRAPPIIATPVGFILKVKTRKLSRESPFLARAAAPVTRTSAKVAKSDNSEYHSQNSPGFNMYLLFPVF